MVNWFEKNGLVGVLFQKFYKIIPGILKKLDYIINYLFLIENNNTYET